MDKTAAELYETTRRLQNSPQKVTLLEETIRLADLTQDTETALQARDDLIDAANWSGQGEKALVAFAWILAQYDRKAPEERGWYDTYHTLWRYKWMFSIAQDLPSISLARVEAMFEDLSRRLQENGYGQRVIAHKRLSFAIHKGDREEAKQHYNTWRNLNRDGMSDCNACEANEEVMYHLFIGDAEAALRKAKPLLEGRLTCHSVPTITYASVLEPLMRLGKLEEAVTYHRKSIKATLRDPLFIASAAEHGAFLALTGNLEAARRVFEKTLTWALASNEQDTRFTYFGNMLTWLLVLEGRNETLLTMNAPANLPVKPAETLRNARLKRAKEYELASLREWVEQELEGLAARFDARIGRPEYAKLIGKYRQVLELAVDYPLEVATTT